MSMVDEILVHDKEMSKKVTIMRILNHLTLLVIHVGALTTEGKSDPSFKRDATNVIY